jgi:cellulose biosynthesis protein BcsQ
MDPRSMPRAPGPIVFGVMAGKGGVGKTLIACNFARVISWSVPVAVVDLDLYNRGASALLAPDGIAPGTDTVYALLERASKGKGERQSVGGWGQELGLQELNPVIVESKTKDGQQLLLVPSSLTGDPVERLEYNFTVPETRDLLERLSQALVEKFEVRCVVFDCKAGPDPLALAVVGLATETLLISEFNPITFDGTLNFYQHICKAYGAADLVNSRIGPLNVIINKVPEKFNLSKPDTMADLSDRLRPLHLLDAFPFEYDVFQGFGDFKFVVDDLPQTMFCAKIARLAERLLVSRRVMLHAKVNEAARRVHRGAYRGVRARRLRIVLFVALLGAVCVLLGISVPIGQQITADGIHSLPRPYVMVAAIVAATLAGIGGLAVMLFRLFRD